MKDNSKVTLKVRLDKRLAENEKLALKGLENTRNNALAFWYGYSLALKEIRKSLLMDS
jgi:hypothetical protein